MNSSPRSCVIFRALALALLAAPSLPAGESRAAAASPDSSVLAEFTVTEGELTYRVSCDGEDLIKPSQISLIKDQDWSFLSLTTTVIATAWRPVWGQFSEIKDECHEQTIALKAGKIRVDLVSRSYDQGVAFRLVVPPQAGLAEEHFHFRVDYELCEDSLAYAPNGEGSPLGPIALPELLRSEGKSLSLPLVMERPASRWMALLDSDLYSAPLFSTATFAWEKKNPVLHSKSTVRASDEGFVTPWKVILLEKNLGDLLTNPLPLNVAAPCALPETDWVKAGLGLWDWRVHGYDNGDFKYGIDTRSYLRLIDFAAEQGLAYLTIDDHWFTVDTAGKLVPVPELDMPRVMAYAAKKDVAIMLYYDRRKVGRNPLIPDEELLKHYRALGAAGIKYGFMGNKADFTRSTLDLAAQSELAIFYHDGPVPMTGVTRTLPHMLTHEYCHAQQDRRRAFSPTDFLKMAMINALAGPLDQANGNFGIRSINAGQRLKGPKKKNSYLSTVVSEVARTLVISSGLVTLPDAPEEYLKKADLFQFLKAMPATWDESQIVNCKMAQYLTTARRTGDTWFVGSVNNETRRSLEIDCNFLQPGVVYEATLYQDAVDSHGVENPEAYRITTRQVTSADQLVITMAMGGGHAMILRPIDA